jgi:hypothetical protein
MTGQRHIAALVAAVAVTLVVVVGFAALVFMAPAEPRIRDATQPIAPADAAPAAPGPESKAVPPTRRSAGEVRQANAKAAGPVTAVSQPAMTGSPPLALPEQSARWASAGDSPSPTSAPLEEEALAPTDATGEAAADDLADAATEPDPETTAAIPRPDAMRTARTTRAVNLRSGPRDQAKVLLVVPHRAELRVFACEGWCEVEYDGTRGFIYKRFLK